MEEWLVVDIHNIDDDGVVEIDLFMEVELKASWCFSVPLALMVDFSKAVDDPLVSVLSRSLKDVVKTCGRWVTESAMKSA